MFSTMNLDCQFYVFSRVVRKAIARVHIVMNQKQKDNLRKLFKVSCSIFYMSSAWTKIISFPVTQGKKGDHPLCALCSCCSWHIFYSLISQRKLFNHQQKNIFAFLGLQFALRFPQVTGFTSSVVLKLMFDFVFFRRTANTSL